MCARSRPRRRAEDDSYGGLIALDVDEPTGVVKVERACPALRDWAAPGDLAREVYVISPDERRADLRPIADDAAASKDEAIRSAGYAVSAGMDDSRAAVLGVAQLAKACGPAR